MLNNINADYRTDNVILFNNDCLRSLEVIPNKSVDLIVTDCPYHIISHGGGNNPNTKLCGGILNHNNKLARQGKLFQYNEIKFKEWLPIIYDKLKDNSHCYICINGRNLADLQTEAEKVRI